MSKRKGHRKKRRRRSPRNARARLSAVAAALNRCEQHGECVRFMGGAIFTQAGAILPPTKKGQKWDARMFAGNGKPGLPVDDLED